MKMAEKFQSLLDKIHEKGVKEAEATAAGIIADAEKEAKSIREKAKTEAEAKNRQRNRPRPLKSGRKPQSVRQLAISSLNFSRSWNAV